MRLLVWIAAVISVAAVLVLCWRLLHGFDFTDESFYIALPYRFALGDQPFVDELNSSQNAGLLLYPFVKLYLLVVGTPTGIFLFVRALWVVFFGLVGWSAYGLARLCIPRPAALLVGTLCMLFLPLSIPGLSYNTISMGLLAAGMFVLARELVAPGPSRRFWRTPMFWAGLLHGAAVFAYPSLLVAVMAVAVAIAALTAQRRIRAVAAYAAGGATVGALVAPLLIRAGATHLREMVDYASGFGTEIDLATLWSRIVEFGELHPELPVALIAVLVPVVLVNRLPLLAAVAAAALPLFAARSTVLVGYLASLGFIACFALFGLPLAARLRERRPTIVIVFTVLVPSLLAAAAVCMTSSNRSISAGVGLYPAAIATAIVSTMFIAQAVSRARWPVLHGYFALAPAVALAVLISFLTADAAYYRDGPRSAMTERVTYGPCLGLYTTPEHADKLDALTRDIRAYRRGAPRALFFYDLPLAYLIANRRPLVGSSWIFAGWPKHTHDIERFQTWARPGMLVILDFDHHYPLEKYIWEHSDILVIRPYYTAYRLR
jgi:hypothetical protein